MERIELTVDGMTCDGCERSVVNALTRIAGVEAVQADHATGAVVVSTERDIAQEQLAAAIEDAGFQVRA